MLPIIPECKISPSAVHFAPCLSAVNKGKGYSEPHLKDLLEVVLPALEVCTCTYETAGKQQLNGHICLGFV